MALLLALLGGCAGDKARQPLTTPSLAPATVPAVSAPPPVLSASPDTTLAALRAAAQQGGLATASTLFTPGFRTEFAEWVQRAGAEAVLQSLRDGLATLPADGPYRLVRMDAKGARWETTYPAWPETEAAYGAARSTPGIVQAHVEHAGLLFERTGNAWLLVHW